MATLGEVLVLLHNAEDSFTRFHGEAVVWSHVKRQHEAFVAEAEESGGTLMVAVGDPTEPAPQETREEISVWIERPDRVRVSRRGGYLDGHETVRVGSTWWSLGGPTGAITNEGDDSYGTGADQELEPLLNPASLLSLLRLSVVGEGRRGDRKTIRVLAVPRETDEEHGEHGWGLHSLGSGADEYAIEVDRASGLLLWVEARRNGEPFKRIELSSVELDPELSPETFELEPPPGESFEKPDFDSTEAMALHEASAKASFRVFVPESVPRDWELTVHYTEPYERLQVEEGVWLSYRSRDGAAGVEITQAARAEADEPEWGDDPPWRDLVRGDIKLCARDRDRDCPQAQALFERNGTWFTMTSESLTAEELADLAALLVPAPTRAA
jgi:outer membrane lipoprotein-sorting protein